MDWQLTEADINKDIKVSDLFHFTAIKVQVRYIDHLFSIYIKSMGKHTVCRLEERKHPVTKRPAVEFVNDTFNPIGRLEKQIAEIEKKVDVMLLKGNDNNNDHDPQSLNGIPLQNEKGGNGNDSVCSDDRR